MSRRRLARWLAGVLMLGKNGQRILKAVHLVCAGAWLGALVAVLVVQVAKPAVKPDATAFSADRAAFLIHEVVLFWAFVGTLVTAVVFALFTKWGFVRHHWITSKWLLALGLFLLTLAWQSPALHGLVAMSDAGMAAVAGYPSYAARHQTTLVLAAVQLAVVVIVFFVSALKPWGRRETTRAVNRKVLVAVFAVLGLSGLAFGLLGYFNLRHLRQMAVPDLSARGLPDGTYRGEADCGFRYAVDVEVARGRIAAVRVRANRDASYARYAEGVLQRIVEAQRTRVDAITGATTSSKCLGRAAANALER